MNTYLVSGAGSGIGKCVAHQIDSEGHSLILLGRNAANLQATLQDLPGKNHRVLIADIRNRSSLQAAAGQLNGAAIDGLIACSGVGGSNQWGEQDRWDDVVTTNLTGTYNFVHSFLPAIQASQANYKHIIVISSAMSKVGMPGYQALCASKAGLNGLIRSWAVEWASHRILVNGISPGWVATAMADQALDEIAAYMSTSREKAYEVAVQGVPLRKMSEPREIADLVSYLLKQLSMTGENIDINCGLSMQ
ncbi:SDR family oxidoreductase [Paraflavitalea sp. CAU 1676]|uniref:SDR family NAD(P)-dependent oxidoreductase n=1 Tax=Paraflavitalea sp. CAU 1676 TaxID=3032598 RepID=UPI0023DCA773|nr:SDR family oxidoreductase [Paraflavitalea sp. CAU 1676]MDF2190002.1 SDR family oxidoreductase [Paraflavitalea sp. CAU 1676]